MPELQAIRIRRGRPEDVIGWAYR